MLKNNKGVTLILLIITVIVILILASLTIGSTDTLLTRTRLQTAATNMKLIQAKVESMNEEYEFNATPLEQYVGIKVEDDSYLNIYGVTLLPDDKWYVWDREILASLGFDSDMLKEVKPDQITSPKEKEREKYVVNYSTGEVIFTTGVEDENNARVYTIKQITATMHINPKEAE